MRLVIDMNLSVGWTAALQSRTVDPVHWSAIGPGAASDDDIMAWARTNRAVVLTRDLDFGIALTRQGLIAPSVIQLRDGRVRLDHHLPLVQRVLAEHAAHLDAGALITLDDDRVRVRVLDRNTTA